MVIYSFKSQHFWKYIIFCFRLSLSLLIAFIIVIISPPITPIRHNFHAHFFQRSFVQLSPKCVRLRLLFLVYLIVIFVCVFLHLHGGCFGRVCVFSSLQIAVSWGVWGASARFLGAIELARIGTWHNLSFIGTKFNVTEQEIKS